MKQQNELLMELKSNWINNKLIDKYPFVVKCKNEDEYENDVPIHMCMMLCEYFSYKMFGMELPYKQNSDWYVCLIDDDKSTMGIKFDENQIVYLYNRTIELLVEVEDYESCNKLQLMYELYNKFSK